MGQESQVGRWRRRGRARWAAATLACSLVTAGTTVLSSAEAAGATTVTVQPGQTLSGIARQFHTTVAALATANGLSNPNRVMAGSVLVIPGTSPAAGSSSAANGGLVVVVTHGQTLTAIAAHYGTTVAALVAANHIANPNLVQAGAHLHIPAASGVWPAGGATPTGSGAMQLTSFSVPAALAAYPARMALQPDFVQAAARYHAPLAVLEAMCWWESGWQVDIVSSTGAIGVCQIEPATAVWINAFAGGGTLNPKVPVQNIDLGAAYLAWLIRATGGNVGLALAGYYQGLQSVSSRGMFAATATYVRGIEAYAALFGG